MNDPTGAMEVMMVRVFGPIAWNEEFERWTGRIRLDFFSDYKCSYARPEDLAPADWRPSTGEVDAAGEFELMLTNPAWGESSFLGLTRLISLLFRLIGRPRGQPSRRQKQALSDFLDRRDEVCSRVANSIYDHYRCHWGDWREPAAPGAEGPYHDELLIPELLSRDGLKDVIALILVSVIDYPGIKMGVLGFCFDCTWDGEHGLGVLVRDGEVIEIGENDLTWRGPPSAGEYRPVPPTERQIAIQHGIAAVKKLGGRVKVESDDVEIDLLGNDRIDDTDLRSLGYFSDLRQVRVASPRITDAGLDVLREFRDLRLLELSGAAITDAGLGKLLELRNLSHLYLTGTRISDAGLKDLRKLSALSGLHIGGTGVTNLGMTEIAALPGLKYLDLSDTEVTDAGIRELGGQHDLLSLDLHRTRVTDAALAALKECKRLRYLILSHCHITDVGLGSLKEIQSLRSLQLVSTATTDAGIADLQRAISGLQVVR